MAIGIKIILRQRGEGVRESENRVTVEMCDGLPVNMLVRPLGATFMKACSTESTQSLLGATPRAALMNDNKRRLIGEAENGWVLTHSVS